jgi:proteic killer suppression protein
MIRSVKTDWLERIREGACPRGFPADLMRSTQRKLAMLDGAVELKDLRTPPGNRLEALRGDRQGQHSIRINDQWRLCFVWSDGGVEDLELVDYH